MNPELLSTFSLLRSQSTASEIKSVIDRKRPTCRNSNRLHTQPFWMPLEINTLWCFKSVPDLCFSRLFAVLGKAKYHYRPLRASRKNDILNLTFDLDLWPWPRTLTLTFDLDLKTGWKTTKCHVKTRFITVWPWPLTYDLDLQSQPSLGQGQSSCQKSRL